MNSGPLVIDAHLAGGEGPHTASRSVSVTFVAGVHGAVLGPVGRWVAVDNACSRALKLL
ncbi:hypothetical protein [Dactylosporangium sp. CA-233914]|uniref:hypothetical protein n=1 Tax=Dactylosporangium sp. CA-233914 TaxID=3239934 RepID=UPI003D91828D